MSFTNSCTITANITSADTKITLPGICKKPRSACISNDIVYERVNMSVIKAINVTYMSVIVLYMPNKSVFAGSATTLWPRITASQRINGFFPSNIRRLFLIITQTQISLRQVLEK